MQNRSSAGKRRRRRNFKVWPCNWNAVQVFLRANSQIRYAGMSGYPTGIEHQAAWRVIDQIVQLRPGEDCPRGYALHLFDQFRILEDTAIAELQKRHQEQARREQRK